MTENSSRQKTWTYPLVEAIVKRRSRRFALGAEIPDGPYAYKSKKEPVPLTDLETAYLLLAGSGLSGVNLAEVPLGDGANSWLGYKGRTWPSPCSSHATHLFFTNDDGFFLYKPEQRDPQNMQELISLSDEEGLVGSVKDCIIKISDGRLDIQPSRSMIRANLWHANLPGTTLFMPIVDFSVESINYLLFATDYSRQYQVDGPDAKPIGIRTQGTPVPLFLFEKLLAMAVVMEAAFITQNMLLVAQAIGLGAFPYGGYVSLIIMGGTPLTKGMGFRFVSGKMKGELPNPVGIDRVIEGHCPPYYKDMSAAVDSVLEAKFGPQGCFAPGHEPAPWKEALAVQAAMPKFTDEAIRHTKAVCKYVYETYGKFPAFFDSMNLPILVQVSHLDLDFYDKFYREGAVTETHREHMAIWHRK